MVRMWRREVQDEDVMAAIRMNWWQIRVVVIQPCSFCRNLKPRWLLLLERLVCWLCDFLEQASLQEDLRSIFRDQGRYRTISNVNRRPTNSLPWLLTTRNSHKIGEWCGGRFSYRHHHSSLGCCSDQWC